MKRCLRVLFWDWPRTIERFRGLWGVSPWEGNSRLKIWFSSMFRSGCGWKVTMNLPLAPRLCTTFNYGPEGSSPWTFPSDTSLWGGKIWVIKKSLPGNHTSRVFTLGYLGFHLFKCFLSLPLGYMPSLQICFSISNLCFKWAIWTGPAWWCWGVQVPVCGAHHTVIEHMGDRGRKPETLEQLLPQCYVVR